jgi:hypothetical protein
MDSFIRIYREHNVNKRYIEVAVLCRSSKAGIFSASGKFGRLFSAGMVVSWDAHEAHERCWLRADVSYAIAC